MEYGSLLKAVMYFNFINQCVNTIKDFYLRNEPKKCCEYLYKEAVYKWMKEEEVIDDISIILVFFE